MWGRNMWKAQPTEREAELVKVEFLGREACVPSSGASVEGAETESKRQGLFGEAEPILRGGGVSNREAGAEAVPGLAAQASLAPC